MFVDDLFNKKTLTENNGGGSPWHSEPEQQQMDANRRGRLGRERNAGLDEPDDAPSGSAPTGNGVYEYTVPAGQESVAQELGLQQHRGHWVSRVPIQRANFQFGRPQFHEIPSQGVSEGQLDELSFKDIQKGANRFAKGATKFTKNVADTGAAVGNAAGALGGAIKQVGKTAIADPLAATYNATKSGLGKASNVAANTYGDVKKGVQAVGKAGQAVGSDIGAAGTAVGKGIQSVGRGVANVAGGTTGALGSVVGGATTGLGRAAASGFNAGVQNVGGDAVDKMQTNIMTPKAADIQKQIATKQDEIKALQATLAGEQSAATTGGKSGIQTGATALIDPDTERPYEKDKLAAMYGYKEPEAAAANTPAAPAAQPQGFNAGNVIKLPGMEKYAKPAAPAKTANFAGPGGYGKTTTGIKAPAAPSSPALAAPKIPSAPRVTAGGPTPAEKANLDKRIAAVAEALTQVERMLESVNSKKSAEMVKAYVDQRFTELGLRNTTECRNIMARVVQESAIRRRQYAKSLAK